MVLQKLILFQKTIPPSARRARCLRRAESATTPLEDFVPSIAIKPLAHAKYTRRGRVRRHPATCLAWAVFQAVRGVKYMRLSATEFDRQIYSKSILKGFAVTFYSVEPPL